MLTLRTILGASWSVSSRLAGRAIDFLTLLLLARVLTPADFGVLALAMSLVLIVDAVLEIPLIQALTRLGAVTRVHLDTAFTLGLLRSTVLFLAVALAAWPMARLYGDPGLVPLALALALGPIGRGLVSPNMVRFVRDLDFRAFFVMEVTGKVAAALLALAALRLGAGYWAIAVNSIGAPVVAAILSYVLAPYRPRLSLAKWREFRELIGWMTASQVLSALNWQLDRLLLGRFVPVHRLGEYTMASDVAVLPTQALIGPAMNPLMAALARIADDEARLRVAFLRAARLVMLISVPACVGMALTADLIAATLLGPQWTGAAGHLRWIALTIVPHAYSQPLVVLALIRHRTRLVFQMGAADLAIRLVLLVPAILAFGIEGVIAVRALLALAMFGVALFFVRRLLRIGIGRQIANLWKVALCAGGMVLCVATLRGVTAALALPPAIELGLVAGAGALVYGALAHALGVRLHTPDVRFR